MTTQELVDRYEQELPSIIFLCGFAAITVFIWHDMSIFGRPWKRQIFSRLWSYSHGLWVEMLINSIDTARKFITSQHYSF